MTNKVKANIITLVGKKQFTKFKKDNCWFCDIIKEKKHIMSTVKSLLWLLKTQTF